VFAGADSAMVFIVFVCDVFGHYLVLLKKSRGKRGVSTTAAKSLLKIITSLSEEWLQQLDF